MQSLVKPGLVKCKELVTLMRTQGFGGWGWGEPDGSNPSILDVMLNVPPIFYSSLFFSPY